MVLKLQFRAPPISLTGQSPICTASSGLQFASSKAFKKWGGDGLLLFTSFALKLNLKKLDIPIISKSHCHLKEFQLLLFDKVSQEFSSHLYTTEPYFLF